jgi:hypothetical protein
MTNFKFFVLSIMTFSLIFISCKSDSFETIQGDWLKGNAAEKIETIEEQFQGFSATMMEVGYRYQELYWAGIDENWAYAEHQVEHIHEAMEQGLVRRPVRAANSHTFIEEILPAMEDAIEKQDTALFFKNFRIMTVNCNSCHVMEGEEYIYIAEPEYRLSPVRKPTGVFKR